VDLVNNLGMEVHDHPSPYPLGCVRKDIEFKVMKQCKTNFYTSVDFIDEVELDTIPLDICGVLVGIPYMYMRDEILMQ
jgi:hypothetical protein